MDPLSARSSPERAPEGLQGAVGAPAEAGGCREAPEAAAGGSAPLWGAAGDRRGVTQLRASPSDTGEAPAHSRKESGHSPARLWPGGETLTPGLDIAPAGAWRAGVAGSSRRLASSLRSRPHGSRRLAMPGHCPVISRMTRPPRTLGLSWRRSSVLWSIAPTATGAIPLRRQLNSETRRRSCVRMSVLPGNVVLSKP